MTTLLRGAFSSFPASSRIAPRFCVSISLPGSHRFVFWNECRSSTRLRALVPATFPSGFFSPFLRPVFFLPLFPVDKPQIFSHLWFFYPSLMHPRFGFLVWLCFPCLDSSVRFPQLPLYLCSLSCVRLLHYSSTASPSSTRRV